MRPVAALSILATVNYESGKPLSTMQK